LQVFMIRGFKSNILQAGESAPAPEPHGPA
jgi:hypothetical protein